jgi:hypothetical protein
MPELGLLANRYGPVRTKYYLKRHYEEYKNINKKIK